MESKEYCTFPNCCELFPKIHLEIRTVNLPMSLYFCSAFQDFIEKRMVINGAMVASFRWTENTHYVLAVRQGTLVVKVGTFIVLFITWFLKKLSSFLIFKMLFYLFPSSSLLLKLAFLETIGLF